LAHSGDVSRTQKAGNNNHTAILESAQRADKIG
jgi:hypothetical protein